MKANQRLRGLMQERGWTPYRMAKESGISVSTVRDLLKRDAEPSLRTLEALCSGLKISLAQFFEPDSTLGLAEEERTLLFRWSALTEENRRLAMSLIEALMRRP